MHWFNISTFDLYSCNNLNTCCVMCNGINNSVCHFGLTELFQFQLHLGRPVLIPSYEWDPVQVAQLQLSIQDVFHVNIHTRFYQKGLLRIVM